MVAPDGSKLIDELLAEPVAFLDAGRGYQLLQAYFAGFPIETLRPLLRSIDASVQRSAAFVVSELGRDAAQLVDELPPLLDSTDAHVVWYVMESIALCAGRAHVHALARLVIMLRDPREPIRRLAMRLIERMDVGQLEAVRAEASLRSSELQDHVEGVQALTSLAVSSSEISTMLADSDPLTRAYGAIALKRLGKRRPDLLSGVQLPDDADVRALFA